MGGESKQRVERLPSATVISGRVPVMGISMRVIRWNLISSHDSSPSLSLLLRPPFVPPPGSWHPRMPAQSTNT